MQTKRICTHSKPHPILTSPARTHYFPLPCTAPPWNRFRKVDHKNIDEKSFGRGLFEKINLQNRETGRKPGKMMMESRMKTRAVNSKTEECVSQHCGAARYPIPYNISSEVSIPSLVLKCPVVRGNRFFSFPSLERGSVPRIHGKASFLPSRRATFYRHELGPLRGSDRAAEGMPTVSMGDVCVGGA